MIDRLPRLPFAATFVVWASRFLTPTEKILWYQHYALDIIPADGCYVGAKSLAERIGMSEDTVNQYRTRLKDLGLLGVFERDDKGSQKKSLNLGWYACLPPPCIPIGRRGAGPESVPLARRLDEHLAEVERWNQLHGTTKKSRTPVRQPAPSEVARQYDNQSHPNTTPGTQCALEGGQGGASPTSVPRTESPLPLVVKDLKDGEDAHAPEQQDGGTLPSPVRDQVGDDAWFRRRPGEDSEEYLGRISKRRRQAG